MTSNLTPTPLVSVVIPAYNQAAFLPETIQSVLNQTYPNLEVIVVNDASPDNTAEVVSQFTDPRLKLIEHEINKGLPASRNSGMRASQGELIALLDADDLFLPEKIQAHVEFFAQHPEVGVSYNARFELNHSSNTIREIWRPPKEVGLMDVVLGFPFSPSDMVVRREWAFKVGLFDESFVNGGEDTDFPCRLALAGCKFVGIDRVLNARRYHSGRKRKNLKARLRDVVNALEATFKDPRCPAEVLAIQNLALKHHLMVLVSLAFIQDETELGQRFLRDLVAMDPTVLQGMPSELVEFLMMECIADDSADHVALLQRIVAQLPEEFAQISSQFAWAAGRGYLIKGMRAILFDRPDQGHAYFEKARSLGAQLDRPFLHYLSYHLTSYAKEFGETAVEKVIRQLTTYLLWFGDARDVRWLKGNFYINRAFDKYRAQEYTAVPASVLRAVVADPSYLVNRGVVKILFHSSWMRAV